MSKDKKKKGIFEQFKGYAVGYYKRNKGQFQSEGGRNIIAGTAQGLRDNSFASQGGFGGGPSGSMVPDGGYFPSQTGSIVPGYGGVERRAPARHRKVHRKSAKRKSSGSPRIIIIRG